MSVDLKSSEIQKKKFLYKSQIKGVKYSGQTSCDVRLRNLDCNRHSGGGIEWFERKVLRTTVRSNTQCNKELLTEASQSVSYRI